MDRNNYQAWAANMGDMIFAAAVAQQCRDHMREGRGGVTRDDMRRFVEEAEAHVEVWRKESLVP